MKECSQYPPYNVGGPLSNRLSKKFLGDLEEERQALRSSGEPLGLKTSLIFHISAASSRPSAPHSYSWAFVLNNPHRCPSYCSLLFTATMATSNNSTMAAHKDTTLSSARMQKTAPSHNPFQGITAHSRQLTDLENCLQKRSSAHLLSSHQRRFHQLSQRSKASPLVAYYNSLRKPRAYKVEKCSDHPFAGRNKTLARLQKQYGPCPSHSSVRLSYSYLLTHISGTNC